MDYKQPNLLVSVCFLILGAGILYFIDIPLYENNNTQLKKIDELTERKKKEEDHTKVIAEMGLAIGRNNWVEKKKKIEPNFSTSEFYIPKTEKFFEELIKRSGMTFGTLKITLGALIGQAEQVKPVANTNIKPTEQPSSVTASTKSQPVTVKVNGPVRKNTFDITATGSYDQLKSLLSIFEKQAYLISVKTIGFGEGVGNQFTFNITGEIYSY
ncbi:MAG: hypothetical protein WCX30_00195 [Candidatus Paceibacterota bacterium]|jgi:hypothetical protein|nr:hypothetical protein [bacterium]